MDQTAGTSDRETRLIREIGGLSDRVRQLRAGSAAVNGARIKALEDEARTKWAELRAFRAAPNGAPPNVAGWGNRG